MPRNDATSTIANADLWAAYFQDEWSRWTGRAARRAAPAADAASSPQVAATAAAQVASFLTLVAAGPIAWLYLNNAQSA